jgi:hypothetical protein
MKKINVLLLLFLMASMLNAQDKTRGVTLEPFPTGYDNYEHFNGPVKAVYYRAFHITDDSGKLVKGAPYTVEEAVDPTWQPWSYFFNETGQLTYMNFRMDDGNLWTAIVHSWDGKIRDIYWIWMDTLQGHQSLVYLDNDIVEKRWIRLSDNKPMGKREYVLNKDGEIIKAVSRDEAGRPAYTMEYSRDDDGRITSRKDINGEGKLYIDYSNYEYNERGLFKTAYMNILLGKEANQQMGGIVYEYDEYGNWIKWISKGWMMIERTIEYYE